jgi:hypothetical protein
MAEDYPCRPGDENGQMRTLLVRNGELEPWGGGGSPHRRGLKEKGGKSKTSSGCEKVDGDRPNPMNFLRRNDVNQDP